MMLSPKTEEEIGHHEDKQYSGGSHKKSDWYHPYNPSDKNAADTGRISCPQHGNNWGKSKRGQGLLLFKVTSQESQFL